MHILTFVDQLTLDAFPDNVAATMQFLLSKGHAVTLVCTPGQLVDRAMELGATVWSTNYQNWSTFSATDVLDKKYDVIHAYPGQAWVWGVKAQKKLHVPFFVTLHDDIIDSVAECADQCAGILSGSVTLRNKILTSVPTLADRVHDMPSFLHTSCNALKMPQAVLGSLRVFVAAPLGQDERSFTEHLLGVWNWQAQSKQTILRWEVVGNRVDWDSLRAGAEALRAATNADAVHFRGCLEKEEVDTAIAGCHICIAPGNTAISLLADGARVIAVAPDGRFDLITRANFWKAVDSNFCDFGQSTADDMLDILRKFLAADAETVWEETDCSETARAYFSRDLWGARLEALYSIAAKETSESVLSAPFMPKAEVDHLTRAYSESDVILEYGSGGSTEIAARMPRKFIMSVESDINWARQLRRKLSVSNLPSRPIVFHADIGPTGPWGRPLSNDAWRAFHNYPNGVWDQNWFRHPDLVLIDGRFRTACLATVLLRVTRPVRVLFDDYSIRPLYHEIEEIVKPVQMIGRMADFRIEPGMLRQKDVGLLIEQFFVVLLHGTPEAEYHVLPRKRSAR